MTAPVFPSPASVDIRHNSGVAIPDFIVPDAGGDPAPRYVVSIFALPAGVTFTPGTRTLSFDEDVVKVGTYTIFIEAQNSDGIAFFRVQYTVQSSAAPHFADDVGASIEGLVGTAIADVLVPVALGSPAPVYSTVGSLPAGVTFTASNRTLSFNTRLIRAGTGTITIRAINTHGRDEWTVRYLFATSGVIPSFAVDTGTTISVPVGTVIADVAIPAAIGFPTPSYAAVGTLPAGVTFDTDERTLSFDETAVEISSGTITIRATNSEGSDDWTLAYAFTQRPPMFSAPSFAQRFHIREAADIPDVLVPEASGNPAYAAIGTLPTGITFNATPRTLSIGVVATGTHTVTIRATNTGGTAEWTYTLVVLPATAPLFMPNEGTLIEGAPGSSVADVLVPVPTGTPTPTFEVRGLPAGATWAAGTRTISFDADATRVGTGTITIRAINATGSDEWTVDYVFAAGVVPRFATDAGTAISTRAGVPVADVVVPEATGFPTPSYAAVGALPAGITFTPGSRTLSFDEALIQGGSGTITIRATNSEGGK